MTKTGYKQMLDKAIDRPGVISGCYKNFHNYSFLNSFLIAVQADIRGLPIGPASSYKNWQKLNRQVRKGEKALTIWLPKLYRKCPSCGESGYAKTCKICGVKTDQRLAGFTQKPVVFLLCQTDGEEQDINHDIPELNIRQAIDTLGLTLEEFSHTNGNVQGYAQPADKILSVNPLAESPTKTLIHEIAHCLLHDTNQIDTLTLTKDIKEVEAESVAYLILELLGRDSSKSRGYIQHWMEEGFAYTEETAERIIRTTNKIMDTAKKGSIEC